MDIECYWSIVIINQIPDEHPKDIIFDSIKKEKVEIKRSWLNDPFNDGLPYGVGLALQRDFSWIFFRWADTEYEADKQGFKYLTYLKLRYPGLDGEYFAKPIYSEQLEQRALSRELVFPRNDYAGRFELLNKICNLSRYYEDNFMQMYIIWQKDDIKKGANFDDYMIKVYIIPSIRPDLELEAKLEFITMGINNVIGESAQIKEASGDTWSKILTGNVFWFNFANESTGRHYSKVIHEVPKGLLPGFVRPIDGDFNFPQDTPLEKGFYLKNENVQFLPVNPNDDDVICIGNYLYKGARTNRKKYLFVDQISQRMLIAGKTGVGKTFFISNQLEQLYRKRPDIGVIILNLVKPEQEDPYKADLILKYGTPECRVDYFVKGNDVAKSISDTAEYTIAHIGLKNHFQNNMETVMSNFIEDTGKMALTISVLYYNLIKFFEDHVNYDDKLNKRSIEALKSRVNRLLKDKNLDKALQLSSKNPKWFDALLKGKKILFDLSGVRIESQRLFANALFQFLKAKLPQIKTNTLKYLIIIDEAHRILRNLTGLHVDDDKYIACKSLINTFEELVGESRSQGLSFMFADQNPYMLINVAYSGPCIKVLFNIDHLSSTLFSEDPYERRIMTNLKNREALMLNDITREKYMFRTNDVFLNENTGSRSIASRISEKSDLNIET